MRHGVLCPLPFSRIADQHLSAFRPFGTDGSDYSAGCPNLDSCFVLHGRLDDESNADRLVSTLLRVVLSSVPGSRGRTNGSRSSCRWRVDASAVECLGVCCNSFSSVSLAFSLSTRMGAAHGLTSLPNRTKWMCLQWRRLATHLKKNCGYEHCQRHMPGLRK